MAIQKIVQNSFVLLGKMK